MIRFASIGSGSRGNGFLIEAMDGQSVTRVLLDCGFPVTRAIGRLEALNVSPDSLSAVILTHEHLDHVQGASSLSKRFGIPLWMSPGTRIALKKTMRSVGKVFEFDPHKDFTVDGLSITPIPVPHDAREPVQFHLTDGNHRLVHLTDLGAITPHITKVSTGCDALIIECNHDVTRLREGPYNAALKKRVAGPLGHLSNDDAADFVSSIGAGRLQHLVAAHLSQENNRPELAQAALAKAVNGHALDIAIATQDEGLAWREIR